MPGARYCTTCGDPLALGAVCARCNPDRGVPCVSCGDLIHRTSRFCQTCGAAQRRQNSSLLPEAAGDVSERREVTVVFVDATDFTATSARLDSEVVYGFIDEAMALLADVVTDYEGTIDKFTGDGLLAVFGAPVAHEDDAERAVRSAWDMQRVVRPLREKLRAQLGFEFRLRIGVHTGDVVAGKIGSTTHAEYTVIGDTVNVASRLQGAAEPDTVCVSEATYERTQLSFRYEKLPPLTLKGVPGPVTAYRVAGVHPHAMRSRGLPGMAAPFVGRDQQLRALFEKFDAIRSGGGRHIVCITGEAGVGKSRLANEFTSGLDPSLAVVHWARCQPLSRSRPLELIADLTRAIIGVASTDPPELQRQAIDHYLSNRGIDGEVAPYIVTLLGLSPASADARLRVLDDQMLQHQTHSAIRRVLLSAYPAVPLVLIVDDIHWIDSVSFDFLQFLVQSTSEERLLLLFISRQLERTSAGTPVVALAENRSDRLLEIALAPLQAAETKELVTRFIPGESPRARAIRSRIIARAEGNPLYIEELVRMLLQRGGLSGPAGDWTVEPGAEALLGELPPTLRGLIITRFDSLNRELRRVLQHAAVVGRAFPSTLLHHIMAGADVGSALEELRKREFLDHEWFGFDRGYAFRHAVIQEAIHGTVLKRDRQALHRQIAEVIEAKALWRRHDRNEMLAYHYGASDDPARALPYLIASAEQASRRHAHDVTVEHCRRALSILQAVQPDNDVDRYRVQLTFVRALKFLGQLVDAERILVAALSQLGASLSRDDSDVRLVPIYIDLLREIAEVEIRQGLLDRAHAHMDEASLAAVQWGEQVDANVRFSLRERMAWIVFQQGKLEEALRLADEVANAVENNDDADPAMTASLYNTLGGILWQYGKPEAAEKFVRRSLSIYHRIGYLFGKANAQANLGVLCYAQGKWRDAAELFEKADWIRREIGCSIGRTPNLMNLGMLQMTTGHHDKARATFESALSVSEQLGERLETVHATIRLAHLAVIEGHFDEASDLVRKIRPYAAGLAANDCAQLRLIEAIVRSQSSLDEAIAIAEEGWTIARRDGVPETEADTARVLGSLYLRRGSLEAAGDRLHTALERARLAGDPYREALALLELGQYYREHRKNSGQDGQRLIEESLRLFTQLGAAYDAERATAALETKLTP